MDSHFGTDCCFVCEAPVPSWDYTAHVRACLMIRAGLDPEFRAELHELKVGLEAAAGRRRAEWWKS